MLTTAASALLLTSLAQPQAVSGPDAIRWLETNKEKEDVVTLPSGLQYKILASGPRDGKRPGPSDSCTCHYDGTLIDGSAFDSSRKRGSPSTFSPSGVIKGWTEALQLMRPGDRWMLYIPPHLGYGSRGAGGRIPGEAVLVFDLELISISVSSSPFAGTPLDVELLPGTGLKAWMALAAGLVYMVYSSFSGGGKSVSASHILVPDRETCVSLKEQLDGGKADFAALAKAHSTCPSKSSGGALGNFGPGQMVPEFDKVCWSAPIGEVQGPVQTQFGYHLILVTSRTDGSEAEKKE